jgi:hypothetical protein
LNRNYTVSIAALRPLYWHSRENEYKGHRDMMAAWLASRPLYSQAEVERLVAITRQSAVLDARD